MFEMTKTITNRYEMSHPLIAKMAIQMVTLMLATPHA
jgi:hypothetical protein